MKEHLPVSPSVASSMGVIDRCEYGYFCPTLRYPARMIELMRRAAREGRDVLADFETLATAWSSAAGDEPLAVRFISIPSFDLATRTVIPGRLFGLDRINKANFAEMLPHLEGIRDAILDGCGSGRGKLPVSGCEIEPATGNLDRPIPTARTCLLLEEPMEWAR